MRPTPTLRTFGSSVSRKTAGLRDCSSFRLICSIHILTSLTAATYQKRQAIKGFWHGNQTATKNIGVFAVLISRQSSEE